MKNIENKNIPKKSKSFVSCFLELFFFFTHFVFVFHHSSSDLGYDVFVIFLMPGQYQSSEDVDGAFN